MINIGNIRLGFATNSSSTHSIIWIGDKKDIPCDYDTPDTGSNYYGWGWEDFTLATKAEKWKYFATLVASEMLKQDVPQDFVDATIEGLFGKVMTGYVDHQSCLVIPTSLSGMVNTRFVKEMLEHISKNNVVVYGGNDNRTDSPEIPPSGRKDVLMKLPSDQSFGLTARYDKKNKVWVLFNRENGARMFFSFDNARDLKDIQPSFPVLVDIKITDFCDKNCNFCYQNSTEKGKHASEYTLYRLAEHLRKIDVLEVALGGGEPTKHPEFLKILKDFRKNDIVANFTTKSITWMENPRKYNEILDNCRKVAFSVSNTRELEIVKAHYLVNRKPKGYETLSSKFSVHIIPAILWKESLQEILKFCSKEHLEVVFLDYKETGRKAYGVTADKAKYVFPLLETFMKDNWIKIGIDTPFAKRFKKELKEMKIPDRFYSVEEGVNSLYIDAVAEKMGKASYLPEEYVSLRQKDGCGIEKLGDYILKIFREWNKMKK